MHSKRQFCNSFFSAIAVTAALAIAIVFALAVPALAQSAVPPTARQAAADPAFAARLARQVPAHPATNARAVGRLRTASPQDQILYDNGPYNGTTDAWVINFGFSVSDSFTGSGSVNGLHFVYWDASTSDLLTTVDIQIGSTSFGGSPQTLTGVTNTFLGMNQFGYALYQADYSFSGTQSGSYVTLSNACTTSGCSVSNPIYWDENSGVGCTSQGCPSTAYENTLGSIPSETFTLESNCAPYCPPQCVSDAPQDAFKIIHNFTGNEQSPASDLAIDPAGKVFGTTGLGGTHGLGLAYRLALSGEDWIFSPLYSFLGGAGGQNPLPGTVGPEGVIYGTADGGLQNCGSSGNQYCGVVYSLRLSPFACPTALCSWAEDVIYQFTGDPDGWSPNGKLVPDQAGNLYGTTTKGGDYGRGTVYELTPSGGGWTEQVIHSFTAYEGDGPNSLLMGHDGNLYGTTFVGGHGGGVAFQLMPSGGGWTEQLIAGFAPCSSYYYCSPLLAQENSGNLYVIDPYDVYFCPQGEGCLWNEYSTIFAISPSDGAWQVTIVDDSSHYVGWPYNWLDPGGYDVYNDLAIDAAGNLYATEGGYDVGLGVSYWGNIYKVLGPFQDRGLVGFLGNDFSDVKVGASGKLYGTTGACGSSNGTVWQLTPQQ